MVIWGLKTCDTCRRARAELPAATFRDIRDNPLTRKEIDALIAAFGADAVNRRSATWRSLGETERTRAPAVLLAAYPALMKRPVIAADGRLYLGWGEETRKALL